MCARGWTAAVPRRCAACLSLCCFGPVLSPHCYLTTFAKSRWYPCLPRHASPCLPRHASPCLLQVSSPVRFSPAGRARAVSSHREAHLKRRVELSLSFVQSGPPPSLRGSEGALGTGGAWRRRLLGEGGGVRRGGRSTCTLNSFYLGRCTMYKNPRAGANKRNKIASNSQTGRFLGLRSTVHNTKEHPCILLVCSPRRCVTEGVTQQ